LVAVRDWTFLLGPSPIRVQGLVGAPLLIASATTALFRGSHPIITIGMAEPNVAGFDAPSRRTGGAGASLW